MSLPLPRFATQDSLWNRIPHSVATQLYPSSPGSRSSTPCYDLAEFDLDNSRTAMSCSPVSEVVSMVPVDTLTATSRSAPLSPQCSPVSTEVVGRGVVESPKFDAAVVSSDMSTITSQFSPLNPRVSPVSAESVDRVVVESPVSDVVPVVQLDMFPDTSQFALLNPQVSHLSLVQLLPNWVR